MTLLSRTQTLQLLQESQDLAHYLQQINFEDYLPTKNTNNLFDAVDNMQDFHKLKLFAIQLLDKMEASQSLANLILQALPNIRDYIDKYQQAKSCIQSQNFKIDELSLSSFTLYKQNEILRGEHHNNIERLQNQVKKTEQEKKQLEEQLQRIHNDYILYISRLLEKQTRIRDHFQHEKKEYQSELKSLRASNCDLHEQVQKYKSDLDSHVRMAESQIFYAADKFMQEQKSEDPYIESILQISEEYETFREDNNYEQIRKFQKSPCRSLAVDIIQLPGDQNQKISEITEVREKWQRDDKFSTKQSAQSQYFSILRDNKALQTFGTRKISNTQDTKTKKKLKSSLYLKSYHNQSQIMKSSIFLQQSMFALSEQTSSAFARVHSFLHSKIIDRKLRKFKKI